MTEQQTTILNILKKETNATSGLGVQGWQLQMKTGYPQPSIRRTIGELRNSGYDVKNIRYVGYVFVTPAGTAARGTRVPQLGF